MQRPRVADRPFRVGDQDEWSSGDTLVALRRSRFFLIICLFFEGGPFELHHMDRFKKYVFGAFFKRKPQGKVMLIFCMFLEVRGFQKGLPEKLRQQGLPEKLRQQGLQEKPC